jgi:excisionase family DNA binding protein
MSRSVARAVERAAADATTTAQFDPNRWFTTEEAADAVRVPTRQMRRWVYNGSVGSVVMPGGRGRRISGAHLNKAMSVEATPASYDV